VTTQLKLISIIITQYSNIDDCIILISLSEVMQNVLRYALTVLQIKLQILHIASGKN